MPEGNPEGYYTDEELKARSGSPIVGDEMAALIRLLRLGMSADSNIPDDLNDRLWESYYGDVNKILKDRSGTAAHRKKMYDDEVLKQRSGAEIAPAQLDRLGYGGDL
tara:strand:+ start:939 stop:1259 length:321 start_codon:yes stop_codon:yes gene_type:complete